MSTFKLLTTPLPTHEYQINAGINQASAAILTSDMFLRLSRFFRSQLTLPQVLVLLNREVTRL